MIRVSHRFVILTAVTVLALAANGAALADRLVPADAESVAGGRTAVAVGPDGAFGALGRGSFGARSNQPVIEMYDDLETLPLAPPLNMQFSNPVWVNHPIANDTPNFWQAQISSFAHVTDDPVGGNDTRKVRLFTHTAQPPDGYFFGWRYNFVHRVTDATTYDRLVLRPTATQPVRVAHDVWNSSVDGLWTSGVLHGNTGFITTRVLWGGTCNDPPTCEYLGFPVGPIDALHYLAWGGGFFHTFFQPCWYVDRLPDGVAPGSPVYIPVQTWHRLIHELVDDVVFRIYIDYLDGQGEFQIGWGLITQFPTVQRADILEMNGSFESQGASVSVDNIHVIGTPVFATDFVCAVDGRGGAGPYHDDLEWLTPGPLLGQHPRWWAQYLFAAEVTNVDDAEIRMGYSGSMQRHRTQCATQVPKAHAFSDTGWRACVDARVNADNHTVRAVALRATTSMNIGAANVTSRLYIGHVDPTDPINPFYKERLYAQTNGLFEPIDPEADSPSNNIPVIGYDIIDIGAFPSGGDDSTICMDVDGAGNLRVTVDGNPYGIGLSTLNGYGAVERIAFEARYIPAGALDSMWIDNVRLECSETPLVVYPSLSLVYLDDFSTYVANMPVGEQQDSDDPAAPRRWTGLPYVAVRESAVSGSLNDHVLEMENVFRNNPLRAPGQPGFVTISQANTATPLVQYAQDTRGWVIGGRYYMTDGLTSRVWMPTMRDTNPVNDYNVTRFAYSAATGTYWVLTPNPADVLTPPLQVNAPIWVDTERTPASMGVDFDTWFTLTIHMNINGVLTYRINRALLRHADGAVVMHDPLRRRITSSTLRIQRDIDRFWLLSSDDDAAGPGSVLYADDIRLWSLPCPGDANNDGVVDFADFSLVLANYGASGADVPGNIAPDADGDGVPDDNVVNFADFTTVLNNYGSSCD